MSHTSLTESPKRAPALIFGTAAVTLVGAFFLVVKPDAPPPVPVPAPPPIPVAAPMVPVTHLSYADATVQVDAKIDRGYFIRSAVQNAVRIGSQANMRQAADDNIAAPQESVWMDVTVRGVDNKARAPLAAVLVIDRSGSMAGDKIDSARMAADRFVRRLGAQDRFAIVSYGTDVSVDLPLTRASSSAKKKAVRVINMIEEGGGTNIDGGLLAARRMLSRSKLGGAVGRVVLISDGRPTEGQRSASALGRHADKLRNLGASLSTLGVGLDYNEDLMESLAASGGGRYHYLKRARELGTILNAELTHATNVVARQLSLHLPTAQGLTVAEAPGFRIDRDGESARIFVGDLAAGETLRVLVRMTPTGALTDAPLQFSAPEVVYRRAQAQDLSLLAHRSDRFRMLPADDVSAVDQSRRDDVRVRVLQVNTAIELKNSMKDYAKGNVTRAVKRLEQQRIAWESVADADDTVEMKRESANIDMVMKKLRRAAPSSASGMDMVKQQKARGYNLMR